MRNEVFREIGFWGSIIAAIVGLANIVICIVNGVKNYETALDGDWGNLIIYPVEVCFSTVLYKVSIGIILLSLLMMFISYLVNVDGILKILMLIAKGLQLVCIGVCLVGFFILQSISFIKLSFIVFAILEVLAFVLYLIDRDHRKTITRVVIFTVITVGSGVVYMLLIGLLCFFIAGLIASIFREPEHRTVVYDTTGKVIGFLKRE